MSATPDPRLSSARPVRSAAGAATPAAHEDDEASLESRMWAAVLRPSAMNALLALVVALLFAAVANVAVQRQRAVYSSGALMLLDQPAAVALGNEGVVVKLNLLRVKYAAILTTDAVLEPAAEEAGVSLGKLRGAQRPVLAPDAFTIRPAVESTDAALARTMAAATAASLADYVAAEQDATGLPKTQQLTLRVIQDAGPAVKVSPQQARARQAAAVAGGAGLVLAYAVLQVLAARRNKLD